MGFDGREVDYKELTLDVDFFGTLNNFLQLDPNDKKNYFQSMNIEKHTEVVDMIIEQKLKYEKIEYLYLLELRKYMSDTSSSNQSTSFDNLSKMVSN